MKNLKNNLVLAEANCLSVLYKGQTPVINGETITLSAKQEVEILTPGVKVIEGITSILSSRKEDERTAKNLVF